MNRMGWGFPALDWIGLSGENTLLITADLRLNYLSQQPVFAVSESKALCHPSSVDSLSTSAATEDHVSMGGWAARKALRVVEHVEQGDVSLVLADKQSVSVVAH